MMKFQQRLRNGAYATGTRIMKSRIAHFFLTHWSEVLLGIITLSYISYFSFFTILRYQTLYAHYFDLGIMHQTVYNTFMSLKTGDFSRFLELTNPHGFDQIKRMAVHNDMFLALLSPFYFIYSGPEMLLVLQTFAVGLGAIVVYGIGKKVFEKIKSVRLIALFFSFAYLMYPPLQRANQFDFHAVVLATPLLLLMYYFYLKRQYIFSTVCAIGALLTKEQVGLTVGFFGLYILLQAIAHRKRKDQRKELMFSGILVLGGIIWFILSMVSIIPNFRHGVHFALNYFGDFGDSPTNVFLGLLKNPLLVSTYIFRKDTYNYLISLLGPFGFISLLSPLHFLISTPELAINLISKSGAMRNIYFHYTAVITPFVVISAQYGLLRLLQWWHWAQKHIGFIILVNMIIVVAFSMFQSPLPYAVGKEVHPFLYPSAERFDAFIWQERLQDENLKVMATGHIAPLFASRRFFYNFSERYDLADYVVLSTDEVYNSFDASAWKPAYEKLKVDTHFERIYKNNKFEVYKKI